MNVGELRLYPSDCVLNPKYSNRITNARHPIIIGQPALKKISETERRERERDWIAALRHLGREVRAGEKQFTEGHLGQPKCHHYRSDGRICPPFLLCFLRSIWATKMPPSLSLLRCSNRFIDRNARILGLQEGRSDRCDKGVRTERTIRKKEDAEIRRKGIGRKAGNYHRKYPTAG